MLRTPFHTRMHALTNSGRTLRGSLASAQLSSKSELNATPTIAQSPATSGSSGKVLHTSGLHSRSHPPAPRHSTNTSHAALRSTNAGVRAPLSGLHLRSMPVRLLRKVHSQSKTAGSAWSATQHTGSPPSPEQRDPQSTSAGGPSSARYSASISSSPGFLRPRTAGHSLSR